MSAPHYIEIQHTEAKKAIREAVNVLRGRIRKAELMALCPRLSRPAFDTALRQLVADGILVRYGTGRSTFYMRTDEKT